ncbi:hypothetical protein AB1Y20_003679 [Prymnesium parvum]|uniref:HSF-type DNA-binding domain-containing protein n=1 Tax=Prymnesium parvum TaxID=97485 RepID=A0AB34J6Y3_PRYPA
MSCENMLVAKPDREAEEHLTGLPTSIEAALMPSSKNIIITEPNEPFRIVHVNEAWCRSCGFDAEEVLGQTCSIMQGPGTCRATLRMLRQALLLHRQFAVQLLNYSKQGRPFMNTLQVGPLYSASGQVTHFIGVVLARYLDGGGLVPPAVQQLGTPALGDTPPKLSLERNPPMKRPLEVNDDLLEASGYHNMGLSEEDQKFSPQDDGGTGPSRVPPFLTKLCEILTAETSDVVTFSPESASFTIWDPSRFSKDVLPRYFKHNKLGSFSQQLHTYGFRRRASSDASIEFYHEQYSGPSSEFLTWIRAGGAVSKRTMHARPAPAVSTPPPQLLNDMWQVQEGLRQLAMTFQQIKAAHGMQIRAILTKLTLDGTLSPESAAYLSSLPPSLPPASCSSQPTGNSAPNRYSGMPTACGNMPSEDSLQAQLEALEAGLPPLISVPSHNGSSNFSSNDINDFQGEETLQMYLDSAPGMNGMAMNNFGFGTMGMGMKDMRQQAYPVDVISSQLYNRQAGIAGGGRPLYHGR